MEGLALAVEHNAAQGERNPHQKPSSCIRCYARRSSGQEEKPTQLERWLWHTTQSRPRGRTQANSQGLASAVTHDAGLARIKKYNCPPNNVGQENQSCVNPYIVVRNARPHPPMYSGWGTWWFGLEIGIGVWKFQLSNPRNDDKAIWANDNVGVDEVALWQLPAASYPCHQGYRVSSMVGSRFEWIGGRDRWDGCQWWGNGFANVILCLSLQWNWNWSIIVHLET